MNAQEILAATSTGIQKSVDGGVTWTSTFSTHVATALARMPNSPLTGAGDDLGRRVCLAHVAGLHLPIDRRRQFVDEGRRRRRRPLQRRPRAHVDRHLALGAVDRLRAGRCGVRRLNELQQRSGRPARLLSIHRRRPDLDVPIEPHLGNVPELHVDSRRPGLVCEQSHVICSNADVVYAGGLDLWKSTDGAATWVPELVVMEFQSTGQPLRACGYPRFRLGRQEAADRQRWRHRGVVRSGHLLLEPEHRDRDEAVLRRRHVGCKRAAHHRRCAGQWHRHQGRSDDNVSGSDRAAMGSRSPLIRRIQKLSTARSTARACFDRSMAASPSTK